MSSETLQTPPQAVHEAHGSPLVAGCDAVDAKCYLCGGTCGRGMAVNKWMGSGFSDQARVALPLSTVVCEACVHVTSRVAPVLGRPPGKCSVCDGTLLVAKIPKAGKGSKARKGQSCPKCEGTGMNPSGSNYRNVSHLYEVGWEGCKFGQSGPLPGYANASKGEKPLMRAFLERDHAGHWFAGIGDTGQLHVLPFAQWNGPGRAGVVTFERQTVYVPADVSLLEDATQLLTAGASKAEVLAGEYEANAWRLCEPQIRAFEERYRRLRGSGWFALAVWLAQRDEESVQRRIAAEKETRDATRKARGKGKSKPRGKGEDRPRRDGDSAAGGKPSLHSDPGTQSAQALAAPTVVARSEPDGSWHDRAVARDAPQSSSDRPAEQLTLFGV